MSDNCIVESLKSRHFEKAEELSINALRNNSLDAQLWLYLAEAMAFQGYGASAMALYNRAWLLDPEAQWIAQAKNDLIKSNINRSNEEVDKLLNVCRTSVTAALIVKNESIHIENCISRIVNAVDEIVVVDTGSTDGTLDILKKFPDIKIINFEWCDDFAAARNAALPYITSDWVLWIDADEYLYKEDIEAVKEAAGIYQKFTEPILLRSEIVCQDDDNSSLGKYSIPRMFRLKDNFRFFGRIHEQIVVSGKDLYHSQNIISKAVRIRFLHFGYRQSAIRDKNKLERNLRLLNKMAEENPDDPAWLFFYGRELFNAERFNEAMKMLSKCEAMSAQYAGFGRLLDVYEMMAKIYIKDNNYDAAEEVCQKALMQRSNSPDILYLLGKINFEKGRRLLEKTEANVIQAKNSFEGYRDIVSPDYSILEWKADALLADFALYQGKYSKAMELYQHVLQVSPFKDNILEKIEFIKHEKKKLNAG